MDTMNRNVVVASVALLAVIALMIYAVTKPPAPVEQVVETPQQEAPRGKLMSVESYVTQNISLLSPIKETMGGTFYVTEIEVEPLENKGHVKYEDGHNAYEADFTYLSDDRTGHTILSFLIKP